MASAIRAGRVIGVLIILQLLSAPALYLRLEAPLDGSPGFLVSAGSHPLQLGLAVVLALAIEASWIGIAVVALPVLKQRAAALAISFVVLAGVLLALAAMENAAVLSMVSLSEAYATASSSSRAQFEVIRGVVAAARNWPHFMARMLDGITILVFNAALYRCAAVPRLVAGVGLIAAPLQIAGVAMALFGYDIIFPMLAPLGVSQLILALWLLAKGLRGQPASRILTP